MANGTIDREERSSWAGTIETTSLTVPAVGSILSLSYASTVFLGAFLLFLVQPLLGKFILPWFGGSPAVWTTAMLVFQVLLFGGYLYAHLMSRLPLRWQGVLHVLLLLAAMATLPIAPGTDWKPTTTGWPTLRIVGLLTACVGLPYFLLSATGPLIQSWHGKTHAGRSPYRLYALSNVGSLLALLAYPLAFERMLSKTAQSDVWSISFVVFAIVCSGCAILAWRSSAESAADRAGSLDEASAAKPNAHQIGLWFGLAATASVLLLATTNQVCLDVAVVPFLWVVPLALYLLTFILCFDGERWYHRRIFGSLAVILLGLACLLAVTFSTITLILQLLTYFGALFASCMVCHGELVKLKPHSKYLTLFYLTISAGGAAGGMFVAILAPLLFAGYFELYFGALAFGLLLLAVIGGEAQWIRPRTAWVATTATLLLSWLGLSYVGQGLPGTLAVVRNFYGVLTVQEVKNHATGEPQVQLVHGRVIHGFQFSTSAKHLWPTTYYGRGSGVGRLLATHRPESPRQVGVVGLGIGTLAAYGRPGDRLRFYEINPAVAELAQRHFTFLKECQADTAIALGDARLVLERESPQQFDVLVLDAFSGDGIPVHLLTREAGEVYLRHLKPDGVLAFHITNNFFDLRPVLAGLAQELELAHVIVAGSATPKAGTVNSTWGLLSRDQATLTAALGKLTSSDSNRPPIVWTDDRNNLIEVLSSQSSN